MSQMKPMTWEELAQAILKLPAERRKELAFVSFDYGDELNEIHTIDLVKKETLRLEPDEDDHSVDTNNPNPDRYVLTGIIINLANLMNDEGEDGEDSQPDHDTFHPTNGW